MNEKDEAVVKNMLRYGGGFEKALAEAMQLADSENLQRIREGLPYLWFKFSTTAWGVPKDEPAQLVDTLADALCGLVAVNVEHNKAVAAIIGRPVEWKDEYLDAARAALAAAGRSVDHLK